MEVRIFQKASQYFAFFFSIISAIAMLCIAVSLMIFSAKNIISGNDIALSVVLEFVSIFLLLYGLVPLYACVIFVVYDWTTTITVDKQMHYAVYYNKYVGNIKLNAENIVEITYFSKSHPRMIPIYHRITLTDGVKIYLSEYIDACCIEDLAGIICDWNNKESIVYEEFLISIIQSKRKKNNNVSYTEKS